MGFDIFAGVTTSGTAGAAAGVVVGGADVVVAGGAGVVAGGGDAVGKVEQTTHSGTPLGFLINGAYPYCKHIYPPSRR